jgi:hypothetical protein
MLLEMQSPWTVLEGLEGDQAKDASGDAAVASPEGEHFFEIAVKLCNSCLLPQSSAVSTSFTTCTSPVMHAADNQLGKLVATAVFLQLWLPTHSTALHRGKSLSSYLKESLRTVSTRDQRETQPSDVAFYVSELLTWLLLRSECLHTGTMMHLPKCVNRKGLK